MHNAPNGIDGLPIPLASYKPVHIQSPSSDLTMFSLADLKIIHEETQEYADMGTLPTSIREEARRVSMEAHNEYNKRIRKLIGC